jgi:para-nitrobenzyl esterase
LKKTDIINITTGKIQGSIEDKISIFKGIPYAEPPIGDLRLNTPQPKRPWDSVLDASNYRPIVPQPPPIGEELFPPPPQSEEECLNLNIWTPSCENEKRPVLFWIHGGSHIYGSGRLLNGRNICRRGNIVLVSINYRLGPLGYLYMPNAPTNIGQLDQIAALEWVHDNIEFFGGDSKNITIFGESAGATSVCTLMTMPKAKGLFRRVISQSSAMMAQNFKLSDRRTNSKLVLNELNLSITDLDEYRKIPVEKIIDAFIKAQQKAFLNKTEINLSPYIDNESIPKHPLKAIQEGYAKNIELIIGSNLEEWKFWRVFNPKFEELEESQIKEGLLYSMRITGEDENKLEDIISTYKKSREEIGLSMNIHEIYDAYMTDWIFRIPSLKFADAQSKHQKNTYMYMFNWKTPYANGRYGAMHALEVAFVFGSFWKDNFFTYPKKTPETEILSNKMMDYWISFARTGNPHSDNALKWPSYDAENRKTMIFDNKIEIVKDPLQSERKMWYNMNQWSQF